MKKVLVASLLLVSVGAFAGEYSPSNDCQYAAGCGPVHNGLEAAANLVKGVPNTATGIVGGVAAGAEEGGKAFPVVGHVVGGAVGGVWGGATAVWDTATGTLMNFFN